VQGVEAADQGDARDGGGIGTRRLNVVLYPGAVLVLGRLRFGSFTCPLIVATASRITWPKRRDAKLAGRELFGFRKPGGPLFVMTTRTLGLRCHEPTSSGNDRPGDAL
jgi:hypothetical protein